jgi:hypothetical protein
MRLQSCRYSYQLSILVEIQLNVFSVGQYWRRNICTLLYHRLHKLEYMIICVDCDIIT